MADFSTALPALQNGQQIRREEWNEDTRMFISQDGELMQQATGEPYPYQLSGYELLASDWSVL